MAEKERGMVKYQDRSGNEVQLSFNIIRNYLVTGKRELVTDQELMFFMEICKARGLNPFAKDCYLVKYTPNEGAAIIVAIDFYRARARAQADCQGWEVGVIVQKKDGELRYSKGLVLEGEKLVGGYFRATPKGWNTPIELEVNLPGFIKKKSDGSVTKFWSPENQPMMIAKVAESQGLRRCWPAEFQGTYTAEERSIDPEILDLEASEPIAPEEPPPPVEPDFYRLVSENGLSDHVAKFIQVICEHKKVSPETAMQSAVNNWLGFITSFQAWEKKNFPEPEPTPEPSPFEPSESPTVADHPETNIKGRGRPKKATEDQLEVLRTLSKSKGIELVAALPDDCPNEKELTYEQAEAIRLQLAEL